VGAKVQSIEEVGVTGGPAARRRRRHDDGGAAAAASTRWAVGGDKGAGLCASRPLRYVSVINDNHLVSLMNFNAAKVN
jgi:hypothetical protein